VHAAGDEPSPGYLHAVLNQPAHLGLEDVGIALADFRQAGYLTNPTLNVNAQIPDHLPRSPEWDYGLSTSLLDALFIPLRKQLAAKALEGAKLRVAAETLQLIADVKSAYYELVAGLQTIDRLQTIAQAFDASLALAQKQFEAGNVTDVTLGLQQVLSGALWARRLTGKGGATVHGQRLF